MYSDSRCITSRRDDDEEEDFAMKSLAYLLDEEEEDDDALFSRAVLLLLRGKEWDDEGLARSMAVSLSKAASRFENVGGAAKKTGGRL